MTRNPRPSSAAQRSAAIVRRCGYSAAAVCLIAAAAALRFYELPNNTLWIDEAAAAIIVRNAPSPWMVTLETRWGNSSPILYPLALWAIQQIQSSAFTVRVIPAVASVLTVAVLLLLPRAGASRWAAVIAAILATLSAEAILHAQDAREYSLDTLAAALLIFGALWQINSPPERKRWKRFAPLCAALFIAPLIQYGLFIACAAAVGTVALKSIAPPRAQSASLSVARRAARAAIETIPPAAAFAAGAAATYAATLNAHWTKSFGSYLAESYYSGELADIPALAQFLYFRTVALLEYHFPPGIAPWAVAAFAVAVAAALVRNPWRPHPIALMLALSLAAAGAAAALGYYPLGDVRQCFYLAPVIFAAAGAAIHAVASELPALIRRAHNFIAARRPSAAPPAWLSQSHAVPAAALTLASAFILIAATNDVVSENPYQESPESLKTSFAALDALSRPDDPVYLVRGASIVAKFYHADKPDNYIYALNRNCGRHNTVAQCAGDAASLITQPADRLWIIGSHNKIQNFHLLEDLYPGVRVQHIIDAPLADLYFVQAPRLTSLLAEPPAEFKPQGELIISGEFDVYLHQNRLIYAKNQCAPEDVAQPFFLHIIPADIADLPEESRPYRRDNLDFPFKNHGVVQNQQCVAVRNLPNYDIAKIRTGQFPNARGSENVKFWSEEAFIIDQQFARSNGELVADADFQIYLYENRLIYAKEPCSAEDIAPRFFLHIFPSDINDLPEDRAQHEKDSLDFAFAERGAINGSQCAAVQTLPRYGINSISTGQFNDEQKLWSADIDF